MLLRFSSAADEQLKQRLDALKHRPDRLPGFGRALCEMPVRCLEVVPSPCIPFRVENTEQRKPRCLKLLIDERVDAALVVDAKVAALPLQKPVLQKGSQPCRKTRSALALSASRVSPISSVWRIVSRNRRSRNSDQVEEVEPVESFSTNSSPVRSPPNLLGLRFYTEPSLTCLEQRVRALRHRQRRLGSNRCVIAHAGYLLERRAGSVEGGWTLPAGRRLLVPSDSLRSARRRPAALTAAPSS